jgi:hypothetical protein
MAVRRPRPPQTRASAARRSPVVAIWARCALLESCAVRHADALPAVVQLTKVGQEQARELGTALRARYAAALLPPGVMNPAAAGTALRVRSSNVQRTFATATGVLTGLLPAYAGGPPVTVRVAPDDVEWIFPNFQACARLRALWRARSDRVPRRSSSDAAPPPPVANDWQAPFKLQLASLAASLPASDAAALSRSWGVVELMDHATARAVHGLPPLGQTTADDLTALRRIAVSVVAGVFTGKGGDAEARAEGPRLGVGRLLSELMHSMDAMAGRRAPDAPRLALYSGHDTTVLPLLLALRTGPPGAPPSPPPPVWPPFAASIVLELWGPPDAPPSARHSAEGGAGAVGDQAAAASAEAAAVLASREPHGLMVAPGAHYVRVLYNFEVRGTTGVLVACCAAVTHPPPRRRWCRSHARTAQRTAHAGWRTLRRPCATLCLKTSARSASPLSPWAYDEWQELDELRLKGPPITRLTGYFNYMRDHPEDALARILRYVDFPEHYVGGSQKPRCGSRAKSHVGRHRAGIRAPTGRDAGRGGCGQLVAVELHGEGQRLRKLGVDSSKEGVLAL